MEKIKTAIAVATGLLGNESVQKFLCGTYSDGSARSLPDALGDELYSPKQKRVKKMSKKKKGKKKKKKDKYITIFD
jgi:hypothetical protein